MKNTIGIDCISNIHSHGIDGDLCEKIFFGKDNGNEMSRNVFSIDVAHQVAVCKAIYFIYIIVSLEEKKRKFVVSYDRQYNEFVLIDTSNLT